MLLATAVVALLMLAASLVSLTWQRQRELTALRQRIDSLKSAAAADRSRLRAEFLGAYPNPVVLIDPRVPKANPWILRIRNSKHRGAGGSYRVGPPDRRLRSIKADVRLLRSLDKTDYYRLVYSIDGQPKPDLLFEYVGKPKLLIADDSTAITIGPNRKSCIEEALRIYDTSDSARLREAWANAGEMIRSGP